MWQVSGIYKGFCMNNCVVILEVIFFLYLLSQISIDYWIIDVSGKLLYMSYESCVIDQCWNGLN